MNLPKMMGGIGVTRASAVAPLAYIAALFPSLKWISDNLPGIFERTKVFIMKNEFLIIYLNHEEVLDAIKSKPIESIEDLCLYIDSTKYFPSQHSLTYEIVHDQVQKTVLEASNFFGNCTASKAYYLSQIESRNRFLTAGLAEGVGGISDQEFIDCLKAATFNPPTHLDNRNFRCPCNDKQIIPHHIGWYHCYNCMAGDDLHFGPAYNSMRAHDDIKKALAKFCDKVFPLGTIIEMEKILPLTTTTPAQPQLRADIYIIPAGEYQPIVIDVRACSPCSVYALRSGSWHTPLVASKVGEKEKIYKYTKSYPNLQNGEPHEVTKNFVPFVVEYSGALGLKASNFVATIVAAMTNQVSIEEKDLILKAKDVLIRSIQQVMARYRSNSIRYFQASVKVDEFADEIGQFQNFSSQAITDGMEEVDAHSVEGDLNLSWGPSMASTIERDVEE
jgi:hypothetical protein